MIVKIRFMVIVFLLVLIPTAGLSSSFKAIVVKISDGDTIWVLRGSKKIKLRLLGIDTPEKYSGKKLYRDAHRCGVDPHRMKVLGYLASKHTKRLLHKGETVTVLAEGRGYYGRVLAFVFLPDGTNFNEKMVSDGYACVYKYHGHKSRQLTAEEFIRLNSLLFQAKKNRLGLWKRFPSLMDCLCR